MTTNNELFETDPEFEDWNMKQHGVDHEAALASRESEAVAEVTGVGRSEATVRYIRGQAHIGQKLYADPYANPDDERVGFIQVTPSGSYHFTSALRKGLSFGTYDVFIGAPATQSDEVNRLHEQMNDATIAYTEELTVLQNEVKQLEELTDRQAAHINDLADEVTRLREDAERWQQARKTGVAKWIVKNGSERIIIVYNEHADAAIDAARKEIEGNHNEK